MLVSSAFQMHPELFPTLALVVGLVLGSFYAVCISRSVARLRLEHVASAEPFQREHALEPVAEPRRVAEPGNEGSFPATSILWPPSHCPQCHTPLRARDLVPVLSYLVLRGRCAACHAPIHPGYLFVELLSGGCAGLLALQYGPSGAFLVALAFSGVLIVASGIDLGTFLLPDGLTLGCVLPAMLCAVYVLDLSWTETLLGATLGAGTFWAVLVSFKKLRHSDGLGLGDVKLMLLIGALCGPLALPFIVIAAGLSALLAFPFFLAFTKENPDNKTLSIRDVPIPFGPFLSFGAFLHLLIGPQILHWWLGW